MNSVFRNKLKLSLTLILIGLLLLNCFGFCWSKFRFLSDEERIEIAIRRSGAISETVDSIIETSQGVETIGNKVRYYTKVQNVMPYRSLKEFITLNQNCCKVSREVKVSEGTLKVSPYGCLSGFSPYFVSGKYILRFKEDGQVKTESKGFAYYMSSCGKIYYLFD